MRVRSDSDILVTDGIAGGATQITGFRRVSLRAIMATASSHGFDAGVPIAHGASIFPSCFLTGLLNRAPHSWDLSARVRLPSACALQPGCWRGAMAPKNKNRRVS